MKNLTDHELTVAVDAAARAGWEVTRTKLERINVSDVAVPPPFDELHRLTQNEIRESVLAPVMAALEALPDRAHTAWLEGYVCADNGGDVEKNPYPTS